MTGIKIVSTGRSVPDNVVTNDDLSKIVDTNDEWITTRTGIKQRHFSLGETNYEIALKAAKIALDKAGIDKSEIGLIIVGTFTPDYATPSIACILQEKLELSDNVIAFDINAACSGFLYSLTVANMMLENTNKKYALVLGSEQISSKLDMTDRGTCVLFGDGAGAVIITSDSEKKFVSVLGSEGNTQALGCKMNEKKEPYIYMDGKVVFKSAVSRITEVTRKCLEKAEMTMEDIDFVICHQANERIIKSVVKQLKADDEKFYINIADYGNTSAASIPIALDEMFEKEMLKPGMKTLLNGFGAGFTWGAVLLEI